MLILTGLVAVLLLILCLIIVVGVAKIRALPDDAPLIVTPYQKNECRRLGRSLEPARRIVRLQRIPLHFIQILIAAEDHRFASHRGVHWRFTLEALLGKRRGGASTITQQLIKNLFFDFRRSWLRKSVEIVWAHVLECCWSKSKIFETYVNVIEFGEGVFGLEAAARTYFGKSASELTVDESLRLAALLPNPKVLARSPDALLENTVKDYARRMSYSNLGFIAPDELQRRIATHYADRLTIIHALARKNPVYREKRPLEVKGLMLHSVGYPEPLARPQTAYQNRKNARSCVHGFIDAVSGHCHRTLRWDTRGAHAGGQANNTHIGIEMCEPSSIRYILNDKSVVWEDLDPEATRRTVRFTYERAVLLFAHLCRLYDLDPLADGVVISHSEGHRRGWASDHRDVEHLWSHFGLSMDQFRHDVDQAMRTPKERVYVEYVTPQQALERTLE